MPLCHVGGISSSFVAWAGGAPIFMMRLPDPLGALKMMERERITHTFYVPALMAAMTQVSGGEKFDFSALQAASYGASPMPLPVILACLQLFPKGTMQQVYGMTEQCGVVTILPPEDHENPAVAHRLVSAGKAIHGVEIEVRDPATGAPVPVCQAGRATVATSMPTAMSTGPTASRT